MNSLTVKILAALVSVLLITTICSQIYYVVHDKHDTEEAVLASVNEDITFKGVVIRNEKVVTYNGGGILDYEYADGSKLSVNSTIAEVYSSEEAIAAKDKIALIDEKIAELERAQNPGTTNYIESEALRSRIESKYNELLSSIYDKDYSELEDVKSELTLLMNIYNIVTNTETSYDGKISELKAEKKQLEEIAASPDDVIKADETGYFVSYADGYESMLSADNTDSLTDKDIEEVLKGDAEPPENAIGKMFDSYSCKIAGIVDYDSRISEGGSLSLMLNTSKNVYDVTVESVKIFGDDEDKMLVVLDCDRLDKNLVESRTLSAKLIFDEYQGIRVPRSAIRFQGDQKGVYVILGKDISFKKINVIYEGSDYVLSENTSDEDCLLLYDQILLEVVSNKDVSDSSKSSGAESAAAG
ncbi:MAG: HlyD family efflux transporter periplasmic adaptor subunit [Ruminococcus sp.]|nr:HlyD family efflux transporter periplasmic adaptor subunit [Ruminococcus sp.]